MRLFALPLLCAVKLFGAVDGTVTNQTSGKPQPGATVTLYRLGADGIESVESVKTGPNGAFEINQTPQGPHLIQTAWAGVTYNHMLPPGKPSTGLALDVYDSSPRPGDAKVSTHMILLEPTGTALAVNEAILFKNSGKLSYNDPKSGTLRFYLPPEAGGKVKVMCTAPQGMPIERAAEKTSTPNVYSVDFPVKPGESRFDITYSMPMTGPARFTSRILHGGGPVRVVAPAGVKVTGAALKSLGAEPSTQASIFEVPGADVAFDIEGVGSLRQEEPDEDEGAGMAQIRPRIYEYLGVVVALIALILALGMLLLTRRAPPAETIAAAPESKTSPKGKRR